MVEYKGRVSAYSQEVMRKESQIKELQGRIDTGDGCEYLLIFLLLSSYFSLSPPLFLAKPFGQTSTAAFHAFEPVLAGSSILT